MNVVEPPVIFAPKLTLKWNCLTDDRCNGCQWIFTRVMFVFICTGYYLSTMFHIVHTIEVCLSFLSCDKIQYFIELKIRKKAHTNTQKEKERHQTNKSKHQLKRITCYFSCFRCALKRQHNNSIYDFYNQTKRTVYNVHCIHYDL